MDIIYESCAGIDIHQDNVVVCVSSYDTVYLW